MAINSYYPKDYFDLPGVDSIAHPSELWWSSQERPAVIDGEATIEYLEVDFGRIREINYLTFDIVKKPIDIKIFYDATSFDDGSHTWLEVKKLPDLAAVKFDNRVDFDGSTNPWKHSEYYFQSRLGETVIATRFVLIQFTRRADVWPSAAIAADIWSVDVANLRTARYVTGLDDTRGILFGTINPVGTLDTRSYSQFSEFRQIFNMPTGYVRGDNGATVRDSVITPIVPNIVGFGFLAEVETVPASNSGESQPFLDDVTFDWEFWDVTDIVPRMLKSGIQAGAGNTGKCWIDVLFDSNDPVPTTQNSQFQFNIRSKNRNLVDKIYMRSPNPLGANTMTDFYSVSTTPLGQEFVTREDDASLIYRIWADIGETGKDVLGNQYREGVRRDSASNAADNTTNTAWFSMPSPSPEGVECLYFDIRNKDSSGNLVPAIIDSVEIDPATPGSYMHIYYSNEGANLDNHPVPKSTKDWENLLWTPVQSTFVLDKNHVYDLPRPIRASWICLEFSNLQPVPYPLPEIPDLPAIQYKTYPAWLINLFNANSTFRGDPNNVSTITNGTQQVRGNIFTDNFTVKDEFTINSRIISEDTDASVFPATANSIDPITLAQIALNTPRMWTGNIAANATGGIFANYIAANAGDNGNNFPSETLPDPSSSNIKTVSTLGDNSSTSFAELATDPIFFDRICRHTTGDGGYKLVQAKFNKKAYFVGISGVRFFRKDYTVERDDPIIHDILAESNFIDSPLIELNTWVAETPSNIGSGQVVYITYTINGVAYTDEPIQFEEPNRDLSFAPVILFNNGARASNVQVRSGPFNTGTSYTASIDYDIAYDPETLTNSILRNSLHWRLVATRRTVVTDDAVVVGRGFVSADESHLLVPEFTTVATTGLPSSNEEFSNFTATQYVDSSIILGTADIDGIDIFPPRTYDDSITISISETILSNEVFSGFSGLVFDDSNIVIDTATGQISSIEIYSKTYDDPGTMSTTGVPSAREGYTRLGIPGIIGRPSTFYTSTGSPTALKPVLYPYMPEEVKSFPVSSMRTRIDSAFPGSLCMYIYTYNYTAAGTFSAQFYAQTDVASTNSTGIIQIPILGGPVSLDFNVNKYMLGMCVDGSPVAGFSVLQNSVFRRGDVVFTSTITAIDTAPATFNQTNVISATNRPYIGLVTAEGERYL